MDTVEAIERATLDAVPPQRADAWDTWLLGLDPGTVGRSHSATPLVHGRPRPDSLPELERRYAACGLPTVLRLPGAGAFDGLRRAGARSLYAGLGFATAWGCAYWSSRSGTGRCGGPS